MIPQPVTYGLVVFAAVFFVGWVTGMGGDFGPNLAFSAGVGVFGGVCFVIAKRIGGRKE